MLTVCLSVRACLDPGPRYESSVGDVGVALRAGGRPASLCGSALSVPELVELSEESVEDGGVGRDGEDEGDDVDHRQDQHEVDFPHFLAVYFFFRVESVKI